MTRRDLPYLTCASLVAMVFIVPARAGEGPAETVDIAGVAVPADCPLALNEHPRLLFTKADVPRLRERVREGILKEDFELLKRYLDEGLARGSERARSAIVPLGLCYHLTGDVKYADACKEWLLDDGSFGVYATLGLYGYDLIYDRLSPEERRRCEEQSLAFRRAERWRPRARFLHALGVYGSGLDDDFVAAQIGEGRDWMLERKQHLNEWAADRGGDGNSHAYIGQHEYVGTMGGFQAWLTCTGEDWFEGFDWAKHMAAYYVYHYLPDRHDTVHIGINCWGGKNAPLETGATNFTAIAAARWQDGLTQWWVRNVAMQRQHDYHVFGRLWGPLLWLDPSVPEIPPAEFPPTRLFRTRGYVTMRSDWSPDAVFAHFHCGRFESDSRNNADNNSFIIYRNGYLACDTGTRALNNAEQTDMSDGRHHNRYFSQTVAHNSITVGTDDIEGNGWTGVCGGQVSRPSREWLQLWELPATAANLYEPQAGEVIAYETTPEFDYIAGDATRSYSPDCLTSFTRQFLYIRPDLFVVFDRVVSADAGLPKRWYLHTMEEPANSGEETPDASVHPEGHFLCSGDTFKATHHGSVLYSRTLLPRDPIIRKLGGPGHRFEVNGEDYDMLPAWHERLGPEFQESIGLGAWRIEIEPRAKSRSDVFLHVLRAGPEDATMPATELLEADGEAGVRIMREEGPVDVWFGTVGPPSGRLRVAQEGQPVEDRSLAQSIVDDYSAWQSDPRYDRWMTDPHCASVIGAAA